MTPAGGRSTPAVAHAPRARRIVSLRVVALPAAALLFVVAGLLTWWGGWPGRAALVWLAGLVVTGVPVLARTARDLWRGRFASDVVAALAIGTAIALQQPVAGLIVVIMQTGGEALERYAEGRASAAVQALEDAAPRVAHRLTAEHTEDIAVDEIVVGDHLLVRPGETIPCDGEIVEGESILDTSRLTGEALPREVAPGARVMSGMLNGDGAVVVRATALASESQYARIVELVRTAEASKSPLQRLADRYAGWFTPLTILVCIATWVVTRDATRVLAVLVVATPCPLILATPIAIIGGINRAATRQIIVRSGGALERLSDVHVAVFDKTGTVTEGRPEVSEVAVLDGFDRREVLRLAGAVEQRAGHLLARSLVDAARAEIGTFPAAEAVVETPGRGVHGRVEGRDVTVGSRRFVMDRVAPDGAAPPAEEDEVAALRALVAIDGVLAASVTYADAVRPSAPRLVQLLPSLGIRRTVLLSGDHAPNVRATAEVAGITEAEGDLLPGDKVARVAALAREGGHVLMVGDGTNDAPALAEADVGIALAGHGGGITAEAADVVILIDDLARVGEAIRIAQGTMRIARQSLLVGLGLSGIAMLFAAAGYITPIAGALLQEVIDIAVIVNALRASRVAYAVH